MNLTQSKRIIEKYGVDESSGLAQQIRTLEKIINKRNNEMARMKADFLRIKMELQSSANNHKFMQIARPARTCINIAKKWLPTGKKQNSGGR